MPLFKESLIDPATGLNSITMSDSCSALTVIDYSNYNTNDEDGHARANFTDYRKVTINRPKGSPWVMFTTTGAGIDQTIPAPSTSTDSFVYTIQDTDVDGIYEFVCVSYPTWSVSAAYVSTRLTVVYYNGVLYKAISSSTGLTPSSNPSAWEVYTPTAEEELLTRYCTVQRILVLCLTILKCQERLVHEAFCLMDSDFCNLDVLCKNKKFLNSVMLDTLINAAYYSTRRSAWGEVERQVDLMKTICNCG